MKAPFKTSLFSITLALGAVSQGQTLEWGSPNDINIMDSLGNTLENTLDNTYIFELGAFINNFTPTASNYNDWLGNWQVFDRADYNSLDAYFTGSADMLDDGTSNSDFLTPGAISFEGRNAYLWVRNSNDPVPGTEWFLARADSWVFPNAIPGCCDEGPPIQWSLSDLNIDPLNPVTPVWGNHLGQLGGGVYSVTDSDFDLQTHTFIPEPSSLVLALLGSGLLFVRRRPA